MQLVDQGLVSLDSVEDMEHILPELERIQVLVDEKNGEFHMEKPQRKITLRMLLTHTSGECFDSLLQPCF
jgi:CubicO group peptidase (beta-lactamase class C family)